jgi:hypothetical protein
MQLFCKHCEAAFAGTTRCPRCGERLLSPQESFIYSGPAGPPLASAVQSTAAGRVATGTLLGLGLAIGLGEIAAAIVGASVSGPDLWMLRLIAAGFGGLVAGAGWDKPISAGATVGALMAGLAAVFDWLDTGRFGWSAAAGLVLPVVAAATGWLGQSLWPQAAELPEVTLSGLSSTGSSLAMLAEEESRTRPSHPTRWVRVILGATLIMAAAVGSDQARVALARGSGGAIQTGGAARGPIVGLEFAGLAIVIGSFLAGVSTGAGLRHGSLTGAIASAGILFAAFRNEHHTLPAAQGFFQVLIIEESNLTEPRGAVYVLGTVVAISAFGGWLGGQMFPPLAAKWRRNRRLQSQS